MTPVIGITASIDQRSPAFGETYSLTRKYAEGVLQSGGVPLIVPHNLDEASLRAVLDRLDGVLLSGGGDIDPTIYGEEPHPTIWGLDMNRDRAELAMAQWAAETQKPLLCICRGTQVLNVATQTWSMVDPVAVPGGSSAMYRPGKILKTGTSVNPDTAIRPSAATAYMLDMTQGSPA